MKPELELLLEIRASLAAPIVVGDVPEGARRVVPIEGGTFEGPRLRGTVVPGGADWQYLRADGVMIVEAQYLLRTDDGVVIQVNNRGMRHGPEAVMRRLGAGEAVDPAEYYFRATPAAVGTRRTLRVAEPQACSYAAAPAIRTPLYCGSTKCTDRPLFGQLEQRRGHPALWSS